MAKERKKEITDLEEKLEQLVNDQCYSLEPVNDELNSIKKKIEKYYAERTQSLIFCSKTRWYSEKNMSYYFNLEKSRYKNKMISVLVRKDGTVSRNQKEILIMQTEFYKNYMRRILT